jgi:hypothetical protein
VKERNKEREMQIELGPVARNIRASLMFRFLEKAKEMERQSLNLGPQKELLKRQRKQWMKVTIFSLQALASES